MARKVLIVQTAFLGDLLLAIPLIKRVKALFPGCEIDLVCRSGFGKFFETQKLVRKSFEIKKGSANSYSDVLKILKNESYDLCICPHQSIRTALFVSSINATEKVGFAHWWNRFFFHKRVSRDLTLPDALRQLSLLTYWDRSLESKLATYRGLGKELPSLSPDISMQIEVQNVIPKSGLSVRLADTSFVLIAPGSQWPTKRWLENGFMDLARNLKNEKLEVALVGMGKEDREINLRIAKEVPGLVDLTDQTDLSDLLWLMTKAEALICNDSGLMHLASVAGLPTVALFGPTTLALGYRPWQNQAVVVEKELFCRPCGKHGHVRCPLNTHECMKSISSQTVMKEFRKVYKVPDQKGPY